MERPYLVVRDQDEPLRESKLNPAILGRANLPGNSGVAADPDGRRPPDMGHNGRGDGEGALGHGHVGVVPLPVEEVERRADELGEKDAASAISSRSCYGNMPAEGTGGANAHCTAGVEVDGKGQPTQDLHEATIAFLARGVRIAGAGHTCGRRGCALPGDEDSELSQTMGIASLSRRSTRKGRAG
jgi:hypothetical protein